MEEQKKTGTTTLGIVCKDGIVVAADRRMTAGYFLAGKKAKKVVQINDDLIVTIAGTVSDIQLMTKLVKAEIKLKELKTGNKVTVKEAANLMSGMLYNNIRKFSMIPGIAHFVMAGKDHKGVHLYDLSPDGTITEIDDYVSSGSGSVMVYGVLEAEFKENLSLKEGIPLALRGINSAIQRDIASGNGVDVYSVTSKDIKHEVSKELNVRADE